MPYHPYPAPEKPTIKGYEWNKVTLDQIKVKDVVYTDSISIPYHFAYVMSIDIDNKTNENLNFHVKFTDSLERITNEKLREGIGEITFTTDATMSFNWWRLDKLMEDPDDDMDDEDESPIKIKIVGV